MWSHILLLKGRRLRTLDQSKPFDIVDVGTTRIVIRPKATGHERTVRRAELEGAYRELVAQGEISRKELRERHSDFNPAYVAAILAALPNVQVKRKPIRLLHKAK